MFPLRSKYEFYEKTFIYWGGGSNGAYVRGCSIHSNRARNIVFYILRKQGFFEKLCFYFLKIVKIQILSNMKISPSRIREGLLPFRRRKRRG
jgi:hypothetical protein